MNTSEEKYFRKRFQESVGQEIYRKLLISIFKTQAQLIRSYDLDINPDIISFNSEGLAWNLIGHGADRNQMRKFEGSNFIYSIREFAINDLRNGRILHGTELVKLEFIQSEEGSAYILISPVEKMEIEKYTILDWLSMPFRKIWSLIIKMF